MTKQNMNVEKAISDERGNGDVIGSNGSGGGGGGNSSNKNVCTGKFGAVEKIVGGIRNASPVARSMKGR